ncbi:hypothetical protein [Mumia sp. DW29H23]|uniref:hypothetical protein n=1 Tax=Mumia sp. DW29H23 TaxID=3421241 RepID=UPI003D68440E
MRAVRAVGTLVVIALAAGAAYLAVQYAEVEPGSTAHRAGTPGDRASAIIDTFASGDHVFVGAEMSALLTPEQVQQVEAAAEASDPPVYVALVGSHLYAGYDSTHHLLAQLVERVDDKAVFLTWDGRPGTGYSDESPGLSGIVSPEMTGQDDQALLRFIERVEAEVAPVDPDVEPFDYWGGVGGGISAGLLMVVGGYAVLMLILGTLRALAGSSFLLPGRWRDFFVGGKA